MIDMLISQIHKDKDKVAKFIADNSKLKQGIYMKLDVDAPFDSASFKDYIIVNDKSNDSSKFVSPLSLIEKTDIIDYFKSRDTVSGLLNDDANKTIDGSGKKILSSTYQTLCINNKFIHFPCDKIKTVDDFIHIINANGYDSLIKIRTKIEDSLKLKSFKMEDENLQHELDYASSEKRIAQICKIKDYISNNFENIVNFIISNGVSKDSKTKLFFYSNSGNIEDDLDSYNREYSYYLNNYLFNKGTTTLIDSELKGSIPFGFNNNEGKPYLKPKGMNINYVKMHSLNEALDVMMAHNLMKIISSNRSSRMLCFDGLCSDELFECNLDEFVNISGSKKSLYIKLHYKDKYVEEYDLLPEIRSKKVVNAKKKIKCINYLNPSKPFLKRPVFEKEFKSEFNVKELLSFLIHIGYDSLNKYSNYEMVGVPSADKGSVMLEMQNAVIFSKYKYLIHDFLTKSNVSEDTISSVVEKFSSECLTAYFNTMFASEYFGLNFTDLLNIKLNLLNKYKKENVLLDTLQTINTKLEGLKEDNTVLIDNDREFYFLLGQLSYYIETQSEGNLDFGIFKFYTEKREPKYIKNYLLQRLDLYSYKINLGNKVFKSLLHAILSYEPETNILVNNECFYIGLCHNNILYSKKNENKKDN